MVAEFEFIAWAIAQADAALGYVEGEDEDCQPAEWPEFDSSEEGI